MVNNYTPKEEYITSDIGSYRYYVTLAKVTDITYKVTLTDIKWYQLIVFCYQLMSPVIT